MSASLLFAINLREKPRLAACARNVHSGTERFRLVHHWSLHIYQYHARLLVADTAFEIFPGSMTLVAPNTVVEYQHRGLSPHIYAHFTLPSPLSDDSDLFSPVFYDLQGDSRHFEQNMQAIAEAFLLNRFRAEIKLWDLLWELAEYGQNATPARHPSLEKALSLIELKLGEPISVTGLAREVGISHNHLTRLFHRATGGTVVAYVRRQRAELAKHLLLHTTIPVKVIATQVNAADYQSFSALMKRETGYPPSYWRRQGDTF